ncbi:chloride channel protein [Actinomycetospora cinnamomea]|uniref:H+/Cl-antiporter ClcA n=1 Tax=Actinomycetospora cinnamomea TaxID=663609 RepID=A0A2U1F8U6_9PSEU|nr:chloride channel protein [Actinomycetospora cinnamomea]PVZ08578.1 H+/Cl- antiporter ClcA [Actinomycetospora cinnamomea]
MATARTLGLAALLGAAVGALAGVYLLLVRLGIDLVWDGYRPRLPGPVWLVTPAVCVAGGLVVGLLRRRHDADTPHDLDDALARLDADLSAPEADAGPPPLRKPTWLLRAGVLGIVSLSAGASLGPEAPLLLLAAGVGERVARILRLSRAEAVTISAAGALSGLFGGPLGAVALAAEPGGRARTVRLLGPGLVAAVTGLVALLLVLPDGHGLRYDLPELPSGSASALLGILGWSVVAALPGLAVGLAVALATGPLRRLAARALPSPVLRAAVAGLLLGVCGAAVPLTLFSGEHEVEALVAAGAGAGALLGLALLKIVATLSCLAGGWFGGQIFPVVLAGMATGLAVGALAPTAPVTALLAASAAAAVGVVLRRPLAVVLILLVFLPLSALVPLVVGAGAAAAVTALAGEHLPAPEHE